MTDSCPTPAQRSFQINEDDLADLERIVPDLASALYPRLDNRLRTQIRTVQRILSQIRWNYGPPLEVEEHPAQ